MYVPASALYLAINPYIHTRMYIPNHILVLQIRLVGHVENGQVTIISFGFAYGSDQDMMCRSKLDGRRCR